MALFGYTYWFRYVRIEKKTSEKNANGDCLGSIIPVDRITGDVICRTEVVQN